jgi:hypothetical protein
MRRGDLAQSEQYYCKEAPFNFLYMGSMFRFREKSKEHCPTGRKPAMRKRNLLSAGYSDA